MPSRIEDYALIGDCETAALVGRDGSIDWLCWPRFDSPACFAALLGDARHGRWKIGCDKASVTRRYRPDTLILETEFETDEAAVALAETERFWREWASRCTATGPWAEQLRRSLITLKALTYAPTGGVVAAPTTSLPERIGGVRNWDYRYCWLRDATLTLLALIDGGYQDEANAWRNWLARAIAGSPDQLQIMYGIAGERRLDEWTLDWLPGYENSSPVRVGNA